MSAFVKKRKELKANKINEVLLNGNGHDSQKILKQLAISYFGLVNDALRCTVWPRLAGVDVAKLPSKPDAKRLQQHKDYNQVVLDVNRCLKRFPPGMESGERMAMQDQLVDVIMRVLVRNSDLHYYQGYHDICVTFLLVLGEDLAVAVMEKLSQSHLSCFMQPTMEPTSNLLRHIFALLERLDPKLHAVLQEARMEPYFALPWVITWFGHVLGDLDKILRVYDFLLAADPLMPIYLSTAVVLYRRRELPPSDDDSCGLDFATLHHFLSAIPPQLPLESIISLSCHIYIQHPPETLDLSSTPAASDTRHALRARHKRGRLRYLANWQSVEALALRWCRGRTAEVIAVVLLSIFVAIVITLWNR